jgi:hypothetical protein
MTVKKPWKLSIVRSLPTQRRRVAFDPADGKILWLASLAAPLAAGPITYMQDGTQYVLVAAGHSLYAFAVNRRADA